MSALSFYQKGDGLTAKRYGSSGLFEIRFWNVHNQALTRLECGHFETLDRILDFL